MENMKLVFLFSSNKEGLYHTIKYNDLLLVVVPTTKVLDSLSNEDIMEGIIHILHIILDFVDVMKYGSTLDIYRAIFASYYFMVYIFCNCFSLTNIAQKSIETVINHEFGDICPAKDIIKAIRAVREDRLEEHTVTLFVDHTLLEYCTPEARKIINDRRIGIVRN